MVEGYQVNFEEDLALAKEFESADFENLRAESLKVKFIGRI